LSIALVPVKPVEIITAMTLTLLTRAYCHLCDEMRDALAPFIVQYQLDVVEIDVDADAAVEERYGDLVPVLLDGATDREICHYHLDVAALRRAIEAAS
jgi:Glutaredoxin-like domain (DUF836)